MADPETRPLQGVSDPFDAPNCFFGEPEVSVRTGEPDPITKRLEKWRILDEGELLAGVNVTLSVGRQTATPDRYQATIVRENEELLVRGVVEGTPDGDILRGTDERPLLVVLGDLEAKRDRLRSKARKEFAIGATIAVVAVVIAVAGLL